MLQRFALITKRYRIIRGMASYAVLWPVGNIVEQTFVEHRNWRTYDWKKTFRFGLWGTFFVGPTLYLWMRLAYVMWPRTDIRSSLIKALTEQIAFDPMAIACFLFGMSVLEGKSVHEAKREVHSKFLETFKVGLVYWPCVQTINFSLIRPRNQVVFTSFFSMLWTAFLAYVNYLQLPNVDLDHHVIDIHLLEF